MSSPPRTVLRTLPVVPNGTWHRVPATPRKHKTPAPDRLLGVKPLKETLQEMKNKTRERLKLNFDIDDWQGELIRRLRQGCDSLMIAGTGYGKSIIFEALAALNKSKIVIVICPLKALERDQIYPRQYAGIEDGPDVVLGAALQLHLETSVVDDLVALLECNFLHTWLDDCGVQLGDAFGKAASRSEAQGRVVAHKDSDSLFDHWDRRFEEEKEEVPDGESEESEQRKHELALDLRCLEVPGGEERRQDKIPVGFRSKFLHAAVSKNLASRPPEGIFRKVMKARLARKQKQLGKVCRTKGLGNPSVWRTLKQAPSAKGRRARPERVACSEPSLFGPRAVALNLSGTISASGNVAEKVLQQPFHRRKPDFEDVWGGGQARAYWAQPGLQILKPKPWAGSSLL
ncbi:hypothetical protein B0H10DRAFT_2196846 [Mycena sp. CBHHK59/15]|nr:hypothetical protein B0H10DRAFT_2196846 [Mycena sp. CBHHK59/15]